MAFDGGGGGSSRGHGAGGSWDLPHRPWWQTPLAAISGGGAGLGCGGVAAAAGAPTFGAGAVAVAIGCIAVGWEMERAVNRESGSLEAAVRRGRSRDEVRSRLHSNVRTPRVLIRLAGLLVVFAFARVALPSPFWAGVAYTGLYIAGMGVLLAPVRDSTE
jgi:hypothetical protein